MIYKATLDLVAGSESISTEGATLDRGTSLRLIAEKLRRPKIAYDTFQIGNQTMKITEDWILVDNQALPVGESCKVLLSQNEQFFHILVGSNEGYWVVSHIDHPEMLPGIHVLQFGEPWNPTVEHPNS
jgi:hypothetical protein